MTSLDEIVAEVERMRREYMDGRCLDELIREAVEAAERTIA